jgi:hypothetical protein
MSEKSIARGVAMNGSQESPMLEDAQSANPIISTEKREKKRIIRRNKKSVFNFVCECGVGFIANHNQARYCSDQCKRGALRKSWREYNRKNKEYRNQWQRKHYEENFDSVAIRVKKYRSTENGKMAIKKSDIKQREKFPERSFAHQAVNGAIKRNELHKRPCESCGNINVHAHHDDYNKVLEVIWLCPLCHVRRHKYLKERYESA